MNRKQSLAAAFVAILMLGTIGMTPARQGSGASASTLPGTSSPAEGVQTSRELPTDQVQDLSLG